MAFGRSFPCGFIIQMIISIFLTSPAAWAETRIGIVSFSEEVRFVEAVKGSRDQLKEDGYGEHTPIREETYAPQEVLWASEDNLWVALIVQPAPGDTMWSASGPVILISDDGKPGQPLIPRGYNLRWGP